MEDLAKEFGVEIRRRRLARGLTQSELALFIGTGIRFIVDLEAGKPTCHLGKSLKAAKAVGLDIVGIAHGGNEAPPGIEKPE